MDGKRYTIFVVAGEGAKRTLRVGRDDIIPDSGKARLRVVDAAPNAEELDVGVAGSRDMIFSGVNFKSEGGPGDVDPETVTLAVHPENKPTVLLRVPNVSLKRGTTTTIVIMGERKLHAFTFTDSLMAPVPGS
jgi:hypothetical protein